MSSTVPLTSLASVKTFGPTLSDETPVAPLPHSKNEGPVQDKAILVAPNPLTEGQTSQVVEKNEESQE